MLFGKSGFDRLSEGCAWGYGIDTNAERAEFYGKSGGEMVDSGFGGTVSRM